MELINQLVQCCQSSLGVRKIWEKCTQCFISALNSHHMAKEISVHVWPEILGTRNICIPSLVADII